VLRRLCLAVLFCLAAWALVDRTSADRANLTDPAADLAERAAARAADGTMASIAETVATPPIDTHPPEARWEALLPQGIGGGSSRSHQPQAQTVDLPGDSSRVPWPVARRAHADPHAARFRPPHLLHTPLLI
jgi:hypothetical protein